MAAEPLTPTTESLPGLATLEQTPGILAVLLKGVGKDDLEWKPTPERWSISEVLAHLVHVEVQGFRQRARLMAQSDCPTLEPYDQNVHAAAGTYSGRDARKMLVQFQKERGESLAFLRKLPPGALEREAHHPDLGKVTLKQMMHEWAFHDLGHIRQVAELYRARVYWPEMGGWQRYYKINP